MPCRRDFSAITLTVCGDNTAMLCVMKTGRNPTMRHLSRTHRVSVAWLHEQYHRERFNFKYVPSDCMAADIFTKSIIASHRWKHARRLINVCESIDELLDSISLADVSVAKTFLCVAVCAQSTISAFLPHCIGQTALCRTLLHHHTHGLPWRHRRHPVVLSLRTLLN